MQIGALVAFGVLFMVVLLCLCSICVIRHLLVSNLRSMGERHVAFKIENDIEYLCKGLRQSEQTFQQEVDRIYEEWLNEQTRRQVENGEGNLFRCQDGDRCVVECQLRVSAACEELAKRVEVSRQGICDHLLEDVKKLRNQLVPTSGDAQQFADRIDEQTHWVQKLTAWGFCVGPFRKRILKNGYQSQAKKVGACYVQMEPNSPLFREQGEMESELSSLKQFLVQTGSMYDRYIHMFTLVEWASVYKRECVDLGASTLSDMAAQRWRLRAVETAAGELRRIKKAVSPGGEWSSELGDEVAVLEVKRQVEGLGGGELGEMRRDWEEEQFSTWRNLFQSAAEGTEVDPAVNREIRAIPAMQGKLVKELEGAMYAHFLRKSVGEEVAGDLARRATAPASERLYELLQDHALQVKLLHTTILEKGIPSPIQGGNPEEGGEEEDLLRCANYEAWQGAYQQMERAILQECESTEHSLVNDLLRQLPVDFGTAGWREFQREDLARIAEGLILCKQVHNNHSTLLEMQSELSSEQQARSTASNVGDLLVQQAELLTQLDAHPRFAKEVFPVGKAEATLRQVRDMLPPNLQPPLYQSGSIEAGK